jgi:hypothetical protein
VGNHDRRQPLITEPAQNSVDFFAVFRVQVPRWFIRQQYCRIIDQPTGDGGALHLAAAQLRRGMIEAMFEANHFRQLFDLFTIRRFFTKEQRQGDIVKNTQSGDQIKLLENKTDFLPADFYQLRFGHAGGIDPIKKNITFRRLIKAAKDVQQGGLAGTGRADDGHHLPRVDSQINATQGANIFHPATIGFFDIF